MPLHLDPLSRRRFLGGGAALVLSPLLPKVGVRAAQSETWALLSDTHIAADPALKSRQGVNMAEHLRKVVAEVVGQRESLAGVIIDGDCAYDDGQPGDYSTLLEILGPLREAGLPVHFTLGNHDDRAHFSAALGEATGESPVEGKHCSVIRTSLANWILLDSLRQVNQVEGEFGPDQLAWIERLLAENPDKPAILVGHHYPQVFRDDIIPSDQKIKISGLVDSEAFLDLIGKHSAAKAYIHGHSHTWLLKKETNGLHQINLPPTAYVFNSAMPSGWVRATLSEGGIELELRALDPRHPKHGETHQLPWR